MTYTDSELDRWLDRARDAYGEAVADIDVPARFAEVERRVQAPERESPVALPDPGVGARGGRRALAAAGCGVGVVLVGGVLYVLVGLATTLACMYLVLPAVVVVAWFREGARRRRAAEGQPADLAGWARQVAERARALRAQGDRLRALREHVRGIRDQAAELRGVCQRHHEPGVGGPAWMFDDVQWQLTAAAYGIETLERAVGECGRQAETFATTVTRDPRAACFDFDLLFLAFDSESVHRLMRIAELPSKLSGNVRRTALPAVPPAAGSPGQAVQAGASRLATALDALQSELQPGCQAVRRHCRCLVDDADDLHAAVSAAVVDALRISAPAKAAARVLLQLSPYTRAPSKRAAVRSVFAREVAPAGRPARARIGRATVAAITHGRVWALAS